MSDSPMLPLVPAPRMSEAELRACSAAFASNLARRRTVRQFSSEPVPKDVIASCLAAAGTAPSGANQQPWHFVAIQDAARKHAIRVAAESAEAEFYATAPTEWLDALAPIGTDASKPYLDTAPWLIAVFAQRYGLTPEGERRTHYYVSESVGIACGMLITALHTAGLATLTHTPSPMGFLAELLERPVNEKAVMLIVAGWPAADAMVPAIHRKPLEEIATFL